MNHVLAPLFQALQQRIQSTVPAIKGIYPELAQLDNYKGYPADWPCLFIEFGAANFEALAQTAQLVNGSLKFRLAYSVADSGGTFIDTATVLGYYNTEEQLHAALQGWRNDQIAPLIRMSVETEERKDLFRVRVLSYSLNFTDDTNMPAANIIGRPQPEIQAILQ